MHLPAIASTANPSLQASLRHQIDHKTKPLGALGQIEILALQLGLIKQSGRIELRQPQVVVFAADHGLADEGVSAYPQAVTVQMVLNMLQGGAAVNVLARQHGFGMTVVDAGVATPIPALPASATSPTSGNDSRTCLLSHRMGPGTRNMAHGPAMTEAQALATLQQGMAVVRELPGNVVAFGEMGIGNTSSASLLLAARLCHIAHIAHIR